MECWSRWNLYANFRCYWYVVTGVEVGHCSNVDRAYCDRTGCSDGRSTRNVLHRPPIPKVATSFSFSKLLYLLSAGNLLNIYDCLASSEVSHESFEIYTVSQKKNLATFLRPITLEILNRSLPNLAQITFSSCWTSCHKLFESTLENSGAIWRITLTANKKVIKVMNWQWLCHAVVSAMLLTTALLILSTEEKLWWW